MISSRVLPVAPAVSEETKGEDGYVYDANCQAAIQHLNRIDMQELLEAAQECVDKANIFEDSDSRPFSKGSETHNFIYWVKKAWCFVERDRLSFGDALEQAGIAAIGSLEASRVTLHKEIRHAEEKQLAAKIEQSNKDIDFLNEELGRLKNRVNQLNIYLGLLDVQKAMLKDDSKDVELAQTQSERDVVANELYEKTTQANGYISTHNQTVTVWENLCSLNEKFQKEYASMDQQLVVLKALPCAMLKDIEKNYAHCFMVSESGLGTFEPFMSLEEEAVDVGALVSSSLFEEEFDDPSYLDKPRILTEPGPDYGGVWSNPLSKSVFFPRHNQPSTGEDAQPKVNAASSNKNTGP